MLIEFKDDSLTPEEKLKILFSYYNFTEDVKIDEEDMPMIVMALNQENVADIRMDEEGGLIIEYYGDEWQNDNEQRTI
jgi:hypothetical protein